MPDINYIDKLRKETDSIILAHYYVDGEVQKIADLVGDSYFLAEEAMKVTQKNIIFCGVNFMGESAKILNPSKRVIMADDFADCPMAHMVDLDNIKKVREEYEDVAVVCYVNSTAEIKSASDVCVTSSNAIKVVKALPNEHIFFVPDENLGRYCAQQLPEKKFIFNDGFCHVHKSIAAEDVKKAKELHPEAEVLAHPECTGDILELADYIGSTSGIIDYATKTDKKEFIICTEMGVFYELAEKNPGKKFYSVGHRQFCPNMKKVTYEKVVDILEKLVKEKNGEDIHISEVNVSAEIAGNAKKPLKKMLELARK